MAKANRNFILPVRVRITPGWAEMDRPSNHIGLRAAQRDLDVSLDMAAEPEGAKSWELSANFTAGSLLKGNLSSTSPSLLHEKLLMESARFPTCEDTGSPPGRVVSSIGLDS